MELYEIVPGFSCNFFYGYLGYPVAYPLNIKGFGIPKVPQKIHRK